jgi:hypothetical protein
MGDVEMFAACATVSIIEIISEAIVRFPDNVMGVKPFRLSRVF